MIKDTEVLIIGAGVAGLYFALNLHSSIKVTIVTKEALGVCNSSLAQGGISTRKDINDTETYIEDTLRAGSYRNDLNAVKILVEESNENINKLLDFKVPFDKEAGNLHYTREGAHSIFRIVHCKDQTGKVVTDTLIKRIKEKENVEILEHINIVDLLSINNTCYGAVGIDTKKNSIIRFYSKETVIASGGLGGIFKNSTNEREIKGLSLSLGVKHNIEMQDIEFIQFHPTSLYEENRSKKFLISESLRGEGGKLLNSDNKRFIDELLPRNVVSRAILEEEKKTEKPYVFLDMTHVGEDFIKNRFPGIYSVCLEKGIDITREKIKVTPAQHYFMGGLKVDTLSRTSMKNLFAVGEASCTGVHGENRLASNSLLEALVFSKRGAEFVNENIHKVPPSNFKNHIKNYISQYSIEEAVNEDKKNIKLATKKIEEVRSDLKDELVNYR